MRLAVLIIALAAGCSQTQDTVKATPPTTDPRMVSPVVPEDARSPYTVTWHEEARTKQGAVLVARIERKAFTGVALTVSVQAPKGVEVDGERTFTIPAAEEPDTTEKRYTLLYAGTPTQDLILLVDGDAEGFGYHARVPWTFGRPQPAQPNPTRDGPAVQVGGHDFGQAVPMTQ